VLFLLAEPSLLTGLRPVAVQLEERWGRKPLWFLARAHRFDSALLGASETLTAAHFPVGWIGSVRSVSATLRHWRREWVKEGLDVKEPLVTAAVAGVIARSSWRVGPLAYALAKTMKLCKPSVLVLGNPSTLDGRIGRELARHAGVPTVAVQHGTIHPRDPLARDLAVSRMCVWGTAGQEALLACGVPREQIVITGDPRERGGGGLPPDRRRQGREEVVVAFSGPGHGTGEREYRQLVEVVVGAAGLDSTGRWRIRLHPKESADLYEQLLKSQPAPNVTIERAGRDAGTLDSRLEQAAVLVTTTSTSGAEALAAGVPVITLERPPGEVSPDFVTCGATTHVPARAADLAEAVHRVRDRGPGCEIASARERYLKTFFGSGDGRAAERVASVILELGGAEADCHEAVGGPLL
jgi:hypothetical protein